MRVDQLFRRSRLYRDKWGDVHHSNGDTYGERTVKRTIDNTDESCEPSERSGTVEQEDSDAFAEEFTAASSGPSAETRGMEAGESMGTEQVEPDEPTETAQTEAGNSAESTDAGTDGTKLTSAATILAATGA